VIVEDEEGHLAANPGFGFVDALAKPVDACERDAVCGKPTCMSMGKSSSSSCGPYICADRRRSADRFPNEDDLMALGLIGHLAQFAQHVVNFGQIVGLAAVHLFIAIDIDLRLAVGPRT